MMFKVICDFIRNFCNSEKVEIDQDSLAVVKKLIAKDKKDQYEALMVKYFDLEQKYDLLLRDVPEEMEELICKEKYFEEREKKVDRYTENLKEIVAILNNELNSRTPNINVLNSLGDKLRLLMGDWRRSI